jgi:hypothetical protein
LGPNDEDVAGLWGEGKVKGAGDELLALYELLLNALKGSK